MTTRTVGPMVRDRGAGAVLVLGIVGILLACAGFLAVLAAAGAARAAASAAADLGALAAATADMYASGDPCEVAERTVERNAAVLVTCVSEGSGSYTVTAATTAIGNRTVVGFARAGPVSAGE